jgi:D-alanyl-D-alanine dipeptidase
LLDLVYLDEYGLLGSNFYWHHRDKIKGATEEELAAVGLKDERVQVHKDLIEPLKNVDREFQKRGFRLYIKEGYRPKELYGLVYSKRVELFGREATDRLLNIRDMPHATGKSVDVTLWNEMEDKEIFMRDKNDGDNALFINFYRDRSDEQSQKYQELQDYVLDIMKKNGFGLGTKNEYFHFNYLN